MYTKNLAIALSSLTLFASVTLYAKTPKQAEVPPCSTSVECDAMAEDLQGKIEGVRAKGLDNLTREEKINYLHLKKKLLAVSKVRTAQGKEELAQAKAKTAQAKAKTAKMHEDIINRLSKIQNTLKENTK